MRLDIISESRKLSFVASDSSDGAFRYIAIYGDPNDGIPEEVFVALDQSAHGNSSFLGGGRPHFLGWINYAVSNGVLVVFEIQSDVMDRTSNEFTQYLSPEDKEVVMKYKSRLENRYHHWHDQAIDYLQHSKLKNAPIMQPNLESGMRLAKFKAALVRNGYKYDASNNWWIP